MAAWQMATAGHHVTAVEQFRADHDRGSSYGDSRIVRRVYHSPVYTRMMADAYEMWEKLMADSGESELFVKSGGIFFGSADNPDLIAAELALLDSGVSFRRMDAAELMRRFPAFRFEADHAAGRRVVDRGPGSPERWVAGLARAGLAGDAWRVHLLLLHRRTGLR